MVCYCIHVFCLRVVLADGETRLMTRAMANSSNSLLEK